ncbi:MAG: serine hydrolase, partial [Planktothrix sp.]
WIPTLLLSFIGGGIGVLMWVNQSPKDRCTQTKQLILSSNQVELIQDSNNTGEIICYNFHAEAGDYLAIETDTEVRLSNLTGGHNSKFLGPYNLTLSEEGLYSIEVVSTPPEREFEISIQTRKNSPLNQSANSSVSNQPETHQVDDDNSRNLLKNSVYNVKTQPPFYPDKKLQSIVNEIVAHVNQLNLPSHKLSISLIDLSDNKCCKSASYNEKEPRFPASITKLFWMVALYGQYQQKGLPLNSISDSQIYKMIQSSDNEPASRLLDIITGTNSGPNLGASDLELWVEKRNNLNDFFNKAGYRNININQKNFPVPYLNMLEGPEGRDLQMRGKSTQPIRNSLTTYDVARLLYEIEMQKSVSREYSTQMKDYLTRDLRPEAWKPILYNSIQGFLGEYLPVNVKFASKVGWTSQSRQDAAIIESPDGKNRYILVIFGDDESYAQNWTIFPEISLKIYKAMTAL